MRSVVFCLLSMLCCVVAVGGDSLKPISELDFYKRVIQAKNKLRFSGTQVQRQEQRKEFLSFWNEEFRSVEIEIEGVISDVFWSQGWATVVYESKTATQFRKRAQLVSDRKLVFKCDRERVSGLKRGDKMQVVAALAWKPGIFAEYPGPESPGEAVKFYRSYDANLDGHFVASKVQMTVGKEVFRFVQSKGVKK